jgi:hypothetical protein
VDEPLTWTYACDFCGEKATREHFIQVCGYRACCKCEIEHAKACLADDKLANLERKRMKAQDDEYERRAELAQQMLNKRNPCALSRK